LSGIPLENKQRSVQWEFHAMASSCRSKLAFATLPTGLMIKNRGESKKTVGVTPTFPLEPSL